jgi:hypothetical protein
MSDENGLGSVVQEIEEAAALPSAERAGPSASAERMRRCRQRRRQGARSVRVELRRTQIETLIRLGWLPRGERADATAVRSALDFYAREMSRDCPGCCPAGVLNRKTARIDGVWLVPTTRVRRPKNEERPALSAKNQRFRGSRRCREPCAMQPRARRISSKDPPGGVLPRSDCCLGLSLQPIWPKIIVHI